MAKLPHPTTVDFESFGIEGRPFYPPVPCGVSIKEWGKKPKYYAFGHTHDNNCTWNEAKVALEKAWKTPDGVLFQNAKFDLDVAEVHMGLPIPPWERVHDTLFLLFLDNPHASDLGLKPSATRLLNMPPEEQDEVCNWLLANQPVPDVKISKSKQSAFYFMKYLPFAPGGLVGKYANGDVDRTEALFKLLYEKNAKRGMQIPYDRERRLMPILLEMERQGIQVDLPRLRADVAKYSEWMATTDAWIIKTIKAPFGINLDSGEELIAALIAAKKVNEDLMPLTATGKFQTNKDALLVGISDKVLLGMLKYRASLKTCVNTFMRAWLEMAENTGGTIHTTWNQVKGQMGTRTGRLSATWFMNIPKEFTPIWASEEEDLKKAKLLPKCPLKGLPPLPEVRGYITPFKGEVLIDRDYSQQEPRILAHFDGGDLMQKYVEDPWVDFHDYAKAELAKMGKFYERKPVKTVNLGLIYGMGAATLAEKNGMSVAESKELKDAVLTLYPGLKEMYKEMKQLAKNNEALRTWGGREYYCEPPKIVMNRMRQFDYKMVNILIQGSAADCTKEAIIRFDTARKKHWRLVLNVHDQLTASVPVKELVEGMSVLKSCMEGVEFDVLMLSEGDVSYTNWNDLKKYDKKGVLV